MYETMGEVKAPDIPRPKRGLTEFERKIADILFAETGTNELPVERILDVAIAISDGLIKEAVDGYVDQIEFPGKTWVELSANPKELEDGDSVKLIIIKEILTDDE